MFIILATGVQVNRTDDAEGFTALYLAATKTQNLEVVKLLAQNGAGQ